MATDNIPDDREISHKGTFKPQIILLFSGKRKSGKDYITNALHERWLAFNHNKITEDNMIVMTIIC